MANLNKVILSGNLTRDAELRQTNNGTNVLSFGIAVNENRKNAQTNQYDKYTHFFDCSIFGNVVNLQPYLTKGKKVCVDGKLNFSSWETQDGQKRSKIEVVVNSIDLCSTYEQQGQQQNAYTTVQNLPQQQAVNNGNVQTGVSNVGAPPEPAQQEIPF